MGDSERTNVFVVGAGASREFGLPTGDDLKDVIKNFGSVRKTREGSRFPDELLRDCFQFAAYNKKDQNWFLELVTASSFIAENMSTAPSIDNFLHTHGHDERVVTAGKLLIARSILDAERRSTLFAERGDRVDGIDFERGERNQDGTEVVPPPKWSWLGELFKLLVAERDYEAFTRSIQNITFISFNYDRCIRQFLLFAARQYFRLNSDMVESLNNQIKVVHPYGSLGELSLRGGEIRGFGSQVDHRALGQMASGIHTFTEGVGDSDLTSEITASFATCDVAIFLGFGFLPLNLKILFSEQKFRVPKVLGTSLGQSDESSKLIEAELYDALIHGSPRSSRRNGQVILSTITCRELFQKHARFLMTRR
ncbi:hypothetical protein [uncultured Roseobacter sp.]|uniref:hypothetical protein n=1 Tax=uncultured Roseobacter sp. TaxID=114847 RepID=UPI00261AE9CF|nr:hypothetical protein [uncultured Roseobacter sp.]